MSDAWLERAAAAASQREARRGGGSASMRGIVTSDKECAACGYPLKGLPTPGACPECGAAFGTRSADRGENEIDLEALDDAQARLMHAGVTALLYATPFLVAGLLLNYVFALMPSLAPPAGDRAWWLVIAMLIVLALPGAGAWMVGCVLLTLSPGAPDDGAAPAARGGSLQHRRPWLLWTARGLSPMFIGGVLAAIAAAWPGIDAEIARMLETTARILVALGCLSAVPLSILALDLCARSGEDRPLIKISLAVWALPLCGAGLALSTVFKAHLGCAGTLIGGFGYFAGWMLVVPTILWFLALWDMRAMLAWSLGDPRHPR